MKRMKELLDKSVCDVVQKGETVFTYNMAGEIVSVHNTIDLATAFLTMSNDAFFHQFGFNFIPDSAYRQKAQAVIGKRLATHILEQRLQSLFPVGLFGGKNRYF